MLRFSLGIVLACLLVTGQRAEASDLSKVFSKVDPAVVTIYTHSEKKTLDKQGLRSKASAGMGSGVIIHEDGMVLTADHVISGVDQVAVVLANGENYEAKVLMAVKAADIALLKIMTAPGKLPHIRPGNSNKPAIGSEIFIVGAPYGLEHSLSSGHLSARRKSTDRDEDTLFDVEFLQTDASVNKGNSGGPMFTVDGQLIGIVSFILSQSGGHEGIGFAVSINSAREMLLNSARIWVGMDVIPLTGGLARALNIPDSDGMLVQSVSPGSLAEALGVREGVLPVKVGDKDMLIGGDIIIRVGPHDVFLTRAGRQRIIDYLDTVGTGGQLEITVLREGRQMTLRTQMPDVPDLRPRQSQ